MNNAEMMKSGGVESNKNTKILWWETSIMATAMVSQCSVQGCLRVIIMHCYDNVGSKHNLANHCRNKFHYHCSYAFPVQFKITEVCGD